MFDDLDDAFDERQPQKGRPLHRRGKKRGGSVIALVLVVLIFGGLAGAGYFGFDRLRDRFTTPDYAGPGQGEAMVEVKTGASATSIGNALYKEDVVKSAKAFILAANDNPDSTGIQVGFYKVKKQMKASDALLMLLDLGNRVSNKVTFPEGTTSFDVYKILSKETEIPVEEFEEAAKDPIALGVPDFWFNRSDGKSSSTKSIEGFLYPDTYQFDPGLDAKQLLQVMVKRFLAVTTEIDFVKKVESKLDITPYDALMVGSLVQSEAGIAEDFPKVARVIYNTLFEPGDEIGYRPVLRLDVTINYGLMLQGKDAKNSGSLTEAELQDARNPWNSHLNEGLPPSPIANPGKGALQGAETPADGDWYFFVAIDKSGRSAFAATHAEHEVNKAKARANGAL
ncbi:endolytic transglycosylase MltG [Catenuloplanes japonicus]|uniref:endolytic transglycosylase MltG n=1 Tax=Catenuloplanes japonicus TaxID=33876 RepID=UPI0005248871|nr:endolytic transglycosylase MltG [Catenuloplanes japonicus]